MSTLHDRFGEGYGRDIEVIDTDSGADSEQLLTLLTIGFDCIRSVA